MKFFKKFTMKKALLTCLAVFATTFCAALGVSLFNPVAAKADTHSNTVYQTDGASVRVFQWNGSTYEKTDRKGIRFHVEMGAGYTVKNGPVLFTSETHERGSFVIAEGYTTKTLVIPTRLLSGDLTLDTDNVLAIDTTEYWFTDSDGNWESVAYIYNVPEERYTDNFSYRGVVLNSAGEVVAETEVTERSLTWVAKQAYNDTVNGDFDWGTDDSGTDLNETAKGLIKEYIPTYNITYKVNGAETTEEVLWGDVPQNVPTEGVKGAWYDTENSEEVNVTTEMTWAEDRTLVLETTTSEDFVLTGVADEDSFADANGNTYSGFKVFATLHTDVFADKTEMDIRAVNVEHVRGGEVVDSGFTLQGVWTLKEQNSLGEWQMRLFFAFDSDNGAKLASGDQIVIKGDSVFYYDGVMYKLTEDYAIDYTLVNDAESYGIFLGYLYNSDVKEITNCAEDNTGNNGAPNEYTIRVEFYDDVMINGEFTFEFGTNEDGSEIDKTAYPCPVFIRCGEDDSKLIPVSGGRYYWNEGEHKILELIGAGDYENKVFGWHSGDELIAAPRTIVKQNGGYYIFQDQMYAYFLLSGVIDKWNTALGDWVVGEEVAQYATSEFEAQGTVTAINDNGVAENEIRINTANHWFPESAKVNMLTAENMSETAPYAVYRTAADGTVTEVEKIRYHGTSKDAGGYHQILGFCDAGDFTVGDIVTIAAGTRFWLGTEYYTVTEEITYYYNGNFWAQNFDASTMGELSSASFEQRAHNQGASEVRMYFTAPLEGYTTVDNAFDDLQLGVGSITLNGTPFTYVRYQRWDASSTWLSFGGTDMIGKIALGDTIVIEEGTTIWSANNVAYKFTEKVEWIYSANPNDANRNWSRVHGGVTVSATADNATVSGAGTFAVGETYTLNVAPVGDYIISSVIVNSEELPLNANNTYTFTVEQSNVIEVQTVVGHKVYFTVPEGAAISVDGNAVANGGFVAVASGDALTFSVAASEGYKLTGVMGATDNGDGTYTVSNVTANVTVTVSVEKLYKVTYSGENVSISADVADGTWVDNGTKVTFTIGVDTGYTLINVENATKIDATTYTATVNGADLEVKVNAKANDAFIDLTERLSMEDRTSWGAHDGEVYLGLLDTGITNTVTNENGSTSTNHYFNTSVNDTWYVGNEAPITANNGVDIMEYIYVNGVSARKLITDNANGVRGANSCSCWLSNSAAYPVYVETTNGSGLMMRLAKAVYGTEFTVTIKAGFTITNANSDLVAVTKDINFNYTSGTISKEVITSQYTVALDGVTAGATVTANGEAVSNGATVAEGTEITITPSEAYNVSSVTVNGEALTANNGVYTFTLLKDSTINVSATIKTYTVTLTNDSTKATVNDVSDNMTITHGQTYSFTVSATSGYALTSVTINGEEQGTGGSYSFTASGATPIVVTAKKLYAVTWRNPTGATISVTANGNPVNSGDTVVEGTSISVTVKASSGYRLDTVSGIGSVSIDKTHATANTFNYTVNDATSISAKTVKMYQITWTEGNFTISGVTNGGWYDDNSTHSVKVAPASNHAMTSITVNGGSNVGGSTYMTAEQDITVTVSGKTATIVVSTEAYPTIKINPNNATVTLNGESYTSSTSVQLPKGSHTVTVADRTSGLTTYTVTNVSISGSVSGDTTGTAAGDYSITISGDVTIEITTSDGGGCLVEGTLVTLADGSKKAVEDLKAGDMLVVFNHETGKYDVAPLLVNTHATAAADYYTVISLYFSNGEVLKIADEHAVFSKTANKYVYINADNAYEFIGHEFVSSVYENGEVVTKLVTLDNVTITEEYTRIFTPVSVWHMNVVADNMLTLSGRTVNFFEYDETMKYDEAKMQADIEKYGLYTYEDFADCVSEEVFNAFPFKYFKVAIEKGEYTMEELMFLFSEYNESDSEK
ncbi:MAG: hypothetical protein IJ308_04525 [Clostridia bacterium]|nr:hypothetical protein [Clostridia bacterium]